MVELWKIKQSYCAVKKFLPIFVSRVAAKIWEFIVMQLAAKRFKRLKPIQHSI